MDTEQRNLFTVENSKAGGGGVRMTRAQNDMTAPMGVATSCSFFIPIKGEVKTLLLDK